MDPSPIVTTVPEKALFDHDCPDLFEGGQALQDFADSILNEGGHSLMAGCLEQLRCASAALYKVTNRFGTRHKLVERHPALEPGVRA